MSNTVQYDELKFEQFISFELIERVIFDLSRKMEKDLHDKNPVFIVVLNGAFMFAADLMRHFEFDCEVDFIRLESYDGTDRRENVDTVFGVQKNLKGRTVVLVEDIVESGNTLVHLMHEFSKLEPKEIKSATLLYKPQTYNKDFKVDYYALRIPNDFVVGYGLDYKGRGRNLRNIYKLIEN